MNIEIFKDIPEYEGIYQISNLGNLKSFKNGKEKILSPSVNTSGYKQFKLRKNNKIKITRIHQLVALVFLNHKTDNSKKFVINHKNFIRTDNRLDNLEIVTFRENTNKKHIKSSSKYTGVCWCNRDKKYRAYININKKYKSLGYYENEYDAHLAYENALKNYASHTFL